jgi:hypothetical protein
MEEVQVIVTPEWVERNITSLAHLESRDLRVDPDGLSSDLAFVLDEMERSFSEDQIKETLSLRNRDRPPQTFLQVLAKEKVELNDKPRLQVCYLELAEKVCNIDKIIADYAAPMAKKRSDALTGFAGFLFNFSHSNLLKLAPKPVSVVLVARAPAVVKKSDTKLDEFKARLWTLFAFHHFHTKVMLAPVLKELEVFGPEVIREILNFKPRHMSRMGRDEKFLYNLSQKPLWVYILKKAVVKDKSNVENIEKETEKARVSFYYESKKDKQLDLTQCPTVKKVLMEIATEQKDLWGKWKLKGSPNNANSEVDASKVDIEKVLNYRPK